MPASRGLVITCEHGGKRVPRRWAGVFVGKRSLLESHRGWDPGALQLAQRMSREFSAPLVSSRTTRLLVDLNRSLHNPSVFSPMVRRLPREERARIVEAWYVPHRRRVADAISTGGRRGATVVHVAVHSFTPVLRGEVRTADVGLLYDPARLGEREFCARWSDAIAAADGSLRVRRNYPYRGASDGLATALRREIAATRYIGIELEVNQALVWAGRARWTNIQRVLVQSLAVALEPKA